MIASEETRDIVKEMAEGIPLKRVGTPDEVSKLIVFLASDDSSYCTDRNLASMAASRLRIDGEHYTSFNDMHT